jgi:alpha-tubulin suppressor-like RCC1 family protein
LADGKAWFVGRGYYESGAAQNVETMTTAKSVPISGTVTKIAAGGFHCLAATSANKVYAWGQSKKGGCGIGSTKTCDNQAPEPVSTLNDIPIAQLSCGWLSSAAVTTAGKLYTWGGNKTDIPVCGHEHGTPQLTPKIVDGLSKEVVVQVACGWDHTLAVTNKGEIYSWGDATFGRLGHGGTNQATPKKLESIQASDASDVKAFMVAAGPSQSAMISRDGKLYLWGSFSTSDSASVSFDRPTLAKQFTEPVKHVALGWNATYTVMGTPDLSTFASSTIESKKEKMDVKSTPKKEKKVATPAPAPPPSAPSASPSLSTTSSSTGKEKDSKSGDSKDGDGKVESKEPIVEAAVAVPEEKPLPLFAPGGVMRRPDVKIAPDASTIPARQGAIAILSQLDRLCSEHKALPTSTFSFLLCLLFFVTHFSDACLA